MCIRRNLLTLPTRVTLTINLKFSPLFFWGEGGAFYVSLLKKWLLSSKQQSNCHSTFYLRKELECRQCSEKRFCILLTICWCVQQTLWEKIKLVVVVVLKYAQKIISILRFTCTIYRTPNFIWVRVGAYEQDRRRHLGSPWLKWS